MDARSVGLRLVNWPRQIKTRGRQKSYTTNILSLLKLWEVLTMNLRLVRVSTQFRKKNAWWKSVATVHDIDIEGPFAGNGDDHFVVRYQMDFNVEGQRSQMNKAGV